MSDAFTFSDLGRVAWMATLKVTVARGFFAGIAWAIFMSFGQNSLPITQALLVPFVWAVFATPLALFTQLLGLALGMIIPALGAICNILGAITVCAGDPFVYLINRYYPKLLDIADFGFINFTPILFITHPD